MVQLFVCRLKNPISYKIMELNYLIIILSFIKFCSPNAEIVTYIVPENCSDREYFVPSLMSCKLCGDHQKSSIDRK